MSNIPRLRDTQFVDLMQRRICNVLLIANPYDAFMLEDDGRVDEKIFQEYAELGLRFPPRFLQVDSQESADRVMQNSNIDLIICMPAKASTPDNDVFDIASSLKKDYPSVPIVVLTPFSHGITDRMRNVDLSIFEYVFCWLGNTDLLISIIKLIEDQMNLDHDIQAGVQMILVVEDNIRFYSSILPNLYKFVLQQSQNFATEALNATLETLRMRGRPKIVLARNYEEAWRIYQQYSGNALGVISDCRFPLTAAKGANPTEEEKAADAGFRLLAAIRETDPYIPLIMESAEQENEARAHEKGYIFIDKNSKKMDVDLRDMVRNYFGFGDFVFRDPNTLHEVARVHNLKELQNNIFSIPRESLLYHIKHNNVSRWLGSRAMFPISEFLKGITWTSLQDVDAHRQIIFDAIVSYRKMKNQGVVAVFQRERFDKYSNFARIGDGSLGGKGRGLAFLDRMLTRYEDLQSPDYADSKSIDISTPRFNTCIPKTVVLCTDVFDEFMDQNQLYQTALSPLPDDDILHAFLRGHLPQHLIGDLEAFMDVVHGPIAIRSSSLLEDSHYQPFAGIYSTYMIPYVSDKYKRMELLASAVKSVYASVFYQGSKDYMTATQNVIDQEKMAVILQEVVGQQHGTRFYPVISGVARSVNYYPIGDEEADEGTVSLAFGLGKYIVDGGVSLRVSPAHPAQVLQMSEMELALRDTQTAFLALDLENESGEFKVDDGFNLRRIPVRQAEADGTLPWVCSTFDPEAQCIYDGYYEGRNRKVISMVGVLQNGLFPLPELMQKVLRYGQDEMRRPVEIEFAINLYKEPFIDPNNENRTIYRNCGDFHLLQIRPMVDNRMSISEDLSQIADSDTLIRSHSAIGHGIITDVQDLVYVRPQNFNAGHNQAIADEIEHINRQLLADNRRCVLMGPGRWGSSDPWLGIPVKWPHISSARVIIEAGLDSFQVDPSQGTHFFQNLTSLGVSYLTINAFRGDGVIQQDVLDAMPAVTETEHVRHIRFEQPMRILVDGIHREAVIMTN
ncbi:MAG: phosphoenolpyruvate synthase [Bacteroidales bacterium]|nr:phosphoenolpyruvate synthase [Candidatus Liminaster caballi]